MTTPTVAREARASRRLAAALRTGQVPGADRLDDAVPVDRRDRFEALLQIYDLHYAPLTRVGSAADLQHHPAVAALKQRCEADWLAELERVPSPTRFELDDPCAAMRSLAARDRLPEIYRWIATDASWEQIVTFLAVEGGPDAGFDDLVAACQVGLSGEAKVELATNYWDEMGNGDPRAVHTRLHDELVAAIDMPAVPLHELSDAALERLAFGGLLATNRRLQPEMLGALGMIELQAGPRCRLVLRGFDRVGAPRGAYPFYEVHAEVDPRHGNDWVRNAIAPIVAEHPQWAWRIVRGAAWRLAVNDAFLAAVADRLMTAPALSA